MAPNAADRKSVRQQEKAARLAERERQEVITSIMSTPPGRAWLWDTLASCHIFVTTFIPDSNAAVFQEGRRSVGLALLADIMVACPDYYIQAMRESNERYISNDNRTAATTERLSGSQFDGGDSGAFADPADDPETGNAPIDNSYYFGSDIYAPEGPGKTK